MSNTRINFDEVITELLTKLRGRALATFLYRLINQLGPTLCRSIIRYCYERLDRINAELPDGNPHKELFKERMNNHKTFLTPEEVDKNYNLNFDKPQSIFNK